MHEMMHAVGFWHEHSRHDRDQHVEILWENIQPGEEQNFEKHDLHESTYLNEVYDTESIMHYGRAAFSKNAQPTILAIGDPNKPIGQRYNLSQIDIAQLNALYDCSGPSGGWSSWTAFGPCDSQCKHRRQRFCASQDLANCPGADYYGVETQIENCNDEKCYAPVDGHWGRWSAWSSCSVTCDKGIHSRTRHCNDPAPMHGGKDCVGENQQVGECKARSCVLGPHDCEFEVDEMCIWTLCRASSNPRWLRYTGPTPSPGTGPPRDHTSGSGYYLYFEGSLPAEPQQTSCFFSQDLPGGLCQNLTFWYHMLGAGMGELKVLLQDSNGINTTVWQKSGEQGYNWIQARVEIQRDSNYKVYFVGVRGDTFRSDIAIDDIFIEPCSAPPTSSTQTIIKAPTSSSTVTQKVSASTSVSATALSPASQNVSQSTSVSSSFSSPVSQSVFASTSSPITESFSATPGVSASTPSSVSQSVSATPGVSASISSFVIQNVSNETNGSASASSSVCPSVFNHVFICFCACYIYSH